MSDDDHRGHRSHSSEKWYDVPTVEGIKGEGLSLKASLGGGNGILPTHIVRGWAMCHHHHHIMRIHNGSKENHFNPSLYYY